MSPVVDDNSAHTAYLVVFAEGSSSVFPLALGPTLIGCGEEVDLSLPNSEVEPCHARIDLSETGATVTPIGKNGSTRVNAREVFASEPIVSGDLLALGTATLGFQRPSNGPRFSDIFPANQLRQRLEQEVERSLRYGRPLAVGVLLTTDTTGAVAERVHQALRIVDVVGVDRAGEYVVLMPETADDALVPARRMLASIQDLDCDARLGIARCPVDGCHADSLLTGARLAGQGAPPGGVASVLEGAARYDVGSNVVWVADPLMKQMFTVVRQLAVSQVPVLIMGETGSGKEIVAQAIHAWSARSSGPMVALNCGSIPEGLLESELFGYDRGAFSGATTAKPGLLETASGGTLLLDEIGECPLRAQASLLRVLETKRVIRLGATTERVVDVRIVAATNRALEQEIEAKRFRSDLFYRLCAARIVVRPLRDRPLDIPVLARRFLDQLRSSQGTSTVFTDAAMQRLILHRWPGNVRELRNLIEFLAATVQHGSITAADLPESIAADLAPWLRGNRQGPKPEPSVLDPGGRAEKQFRNLYDEIRELEKQRISEALEATGGVRVKAAALIGIPLRTLVTKIGEYGLTDIPSLGRRLRRKVESP